MEPSTWMKLIVGLALCAMPLGIGVHMILDLRKAGRRIDQIMNDEYPSRLLEASVKR